MSNRKTQYAIPPAIDAVDVVGLTSGNISAYASPADVVATGTAQSIAHGLGRIPGLVMVTPVAGHDGAGGAGVQFPDSSFTADATSVDVTCVAGSKFRVVAF